MVGVAGASRRVDVGNSHRQHRLLSGCWGLYGAPQRACYPLHSHLRALPVLQVNAVPLPTILDIGRRQQFTTTILMFSLHHTFKQSC